MSGITWIRYYRGISDLQCPRDRRGKLTFSLSNVQAFLAASDTRHDILSGVDRMYIVLLLGWTDGDVRSSHTRDPVHRLYHLRVQMEQLAQV